MIIHAHLLVWNEFEIMPFVLKHYQKFCDKIYIYDNHSTDGSANYARAHGCEVIPFGNKYFDDFENMKCKNECWKVSRGVADYVITADFDELLIDINGYFQGQKPDPEDIRSHLHGSPHHIFKTTGWQIMSEDMPKNDLLEITNGYEFSNYSKSIIFDPTAIKEIHYQPGAHECKPVAIDGLELDWGNSFHVLHYKHIGGLQRTINRYKQYQKRMSPYNRKYAHGIHYGQNVKQLTREWAERIAKSKPLF